MSSTGDVNFYDLTWLWECWRVVAEPKFHHRQLPMSQALVAKVDQAHEVGVSRNKMALCSKWKDLG